MRGGGITDLVSIFSIQIQQELSDFILAQIRTGGGREGVNFVLFSCKCCRGEGGSRCFKIILVQIWPGGELRCPFFKNYGRGWCSLFFLLQIRPGSG